MLDISHRNRGWLEQDGRLGSFPSHTDKELTTIHGSILFTRKKKKQLRGFCATGKLENSCIKSSKKIHGTHSPEPLCPRHSNIRRKFPTPSFSRGGEKLEAVSSILTFQRLPKRCFCLSVSEGTLPISFYEVYITLTPKPSKDKK